MSVIPDPVTVQVPKKALDGSPLKRCPNQACGRYIHALNVTCPNCDTPLEIVEGSGDGTTDPGNPAGTVPVPKHAFDGSPLKRCPNQTCGRYIHTLHVACFNCDTPLEIAE